MAFLLGFSVLYWTCALMIGATAILGWQMALFCAFVAWAFPIGRAIWDKRGS